MSFSIRCVSVWRVTTKQPFERILSLLDRKRFFSQLVTGKGALILKINDGSLLSFRGLQVSKEGHLDGLLNEKAMKGAQQRVAVVFFYSGRDRYFLNTKVVKLPSGLWRILNSTDFYRLNRRDAHRTMVPESVAIYFSVSAISGIPVKLQVRVSDFSASGALIRWAGSQSLSKGDVLKGKLIWLKGKEVPLYANVLHRTRDGAFGIEFTRMDSLQANRLRILSIELQQLVNYFKA